MSIIDLVSNWLILIWIIFIIVCLACFRILTAPLRLIVKLVSVVVSMMVIVGITFWVAPDQVVDIASRVSSNTELFSSLDRSCEYFELNNGNPRVLIGGDWVALKDISSFSISGKDQVEVVINDAKIKIENSEIAYILKLFKK